MKACFIAAGLIALAAVPTAIPAVAQTVVVTPAPEPPPPPPDVVVVSPAPPPVPVTECSTTTTTTDHVIGSKTETSRDCVTSTPQ